MGSGTRNKKSPGDQLDLLFKKFLNEGDKEPHAIYIVHDLSIRCAWDPANEVQQQRVHAWLEKEKQARCGVLPELYLCHGVSRTLVKV